MMNQRRSKEMESRVQAYRDTRHCFTKVFHNEGWAGMYRGLSLYLMHVAAEKAIKLATNDWIRDRLSEAQHGHLSLPGELLAGGCAGLTNVLFFNPLEIVKIRLQVAGSYSSLHTETVGTVARDLGLANVYRAGAACLMRLKIILRSLYYRA